MPPRTTFADKKLKGTQRKSSDTPRTAAEVRNDLKDVREAIAAMHHNLQLATAAILANGMTIETTVTDSNGKTTPTQRVNPAFKVQREALAALRSFKRYLVILQDELGTSGGEDETPAQGFDLLSAIKEKHASREAKFAAR
jgi:hypothetical protein